VSKKFFFESDQEEAKKEDLVKESEASTFFDVLKDSGIITEGGEAAEDHTIEIDALMNKKESRTLQVEYGVYQGNYAVHVTSTHPRKNLAERGKTKLALKELVVIMNEYVPPTLQVELHLPHEDWTLKVISAVVQGGAGAWNFDLKEFEDKAIPRIFDSIDAVIRK